MKIIFLDIDGADNLFGWERPDATSAFADFGADDNFHLHSGSKAIDAAVQRIDPQATFTPENTYFRDDRVKQVVGVKLQVKGAIGFAKPGMPSDGEILVEGNVWPSGRFNK